MSATVAIQTHEIVAYNYAHDSENKIHDDTVAAQYGFKGGLVPGAADYAYLCHPVYRTWGDQWLGAGTMSAKFIKPIYHGEVARAEGSAYWRSEPAGTRADRSSRRDLRGGQRHVGDCHGT